MIGGGGESVLVQWTRDSAYRFFPLIQHDDLGLTLHPVDLATNETLALVGRSGGPATWMDLITCHERVQPLGYLIWAACGKDPAFNPFSILEEAGRSGRYTAAEFEGLSFDGPPPDVPLLSRRWRGMLEEARRVIGLLPEGHAGECVLRNDGGLCQTSPTALAEELSTNQIAFQSWMHPGRPAADPG